MYQFTWMYYKLLVKYIESYIVEFILLRYYFIIQNFRNYLPLIIIPFDISFIFE